MDGELTPSLFRAHLLTSIICKHLWNRRRFAVGWKPLFPVAAFTQAISENPEIKGGNFGGGEMQINERKQSASVTCERGSGDAHICPAVVMACS